MSKMKKISTKKTNRMIAFLLALLMLTAVFPDTSLHVLAGPTESSDLFTVTVKDEDNELIQGAEVTIENETWSLQDSQTTDSDGVASFDMAAITEAMKDAESGAVTVKVSLEEYDDSESEVPVLKTDTEKAVEVTLQKKVTVPETTEYTVTITKEGNGTVTVAKGDENTQVSLSEDGTAAIAEGEKITVEAKPETGYRVSKVLVDDKKQDITVSNDSQYTTQWNVTADAKVEVTFAPNSYVVSANSPANGTITVDKSTVDYDSSCDVTVTPKNGYSVKTLKVNGEEVSSYESDDDGVVTFSISNIKQDQSIVAEFVKNESDKTEVTGLFNSGDAIRTVGSTYIYGKDSVVTFSTEKNGIKIWKKRGGTLGGWRTKTLEITETTEISKIQLYYKGLGFLSGHDVEGVDSLKIVIDTAAPKIELTPTEGDSKNGYYTRDVKMGIKVDELGDYSGIQSIEYFVTAEPVTGDYDDIAEDKKTQSKILYTDGDDSKNSYTESVYIEAAKNNSDDVVFWVKATDRGGNVTIAKKELKIYNTAPKLKSIEVDGTSSGKEGSSHYNTARTAKITIIDRPSTFSESDATRGISIVAKDGENKTVKLSKGDMISWEHNGDTHIATIVFSADANYSWGITYTNKIGMGLDASECEKIGSDLQVFTIDTEAPTGTVSAVSGENRLETWNDLRSELSFGFCTREEITLSVKSGDKTSVQQMTEYYKVSSASEMDVRTVLTEEDLDSITEWVPFTSLTIDSDEEFVVYVRITDPAGNHTYINTDGFIVDKTIPSYEELEPMVTTEPQQPINGIYNGDVDVDIEVTDPLVGGIYSGLKVVSYQVFNGEVLTQSGKLYDFDEESSKNIRQTWDGTITVDSQSNNGNNIRIVIYAQDRSLNSSQEEISIKIDTIAPSVEFNCSAPNAYGFYKDNVDVAVEVEEQEGCSGIGTIEYFVTAEPVTGNYADIPDNKKTQSGILYAAGAEDKDTIWTGNISVDAELNNSDQVIVWVKAADQGGNVTTTKTTALKINSTPPKLESINIDGTPAGRGEVSYYNSGRTAVITITDRASTFAESAANRGIVISAVDGKGNAVSILKPNMISWVHNGDTHTATIAFNTDANYTWEISYINKAGMELNKAGVVATGNDLYKFAVDTQAPTGKVTAVSAEGRVGEWNAIREDLTFGFWSREKIVISADYEDATSATMAAVDYYKMSATAESDGTVALTAADLDKISDWKPFTGLTIDSDEQFVVYIRITDLAGNYAYISTNGFIVDHTIPLQEKIEPEITVAPEQAVNGIYNGDVNVAIKVADPQVGGAFSGIRTISYQVLNMGQETQSGTLYEFQNADPKKSDLVQAWEGSILVDSQLNNSNDVKIVVFAEDNSLNTSHDRVSMKIDITAPSMTISYDNNNVIGDRFFQNGRTATVTITERNFNANDVKINVANTDGVLPVISGFNKIPGSGNEDDTKWVATIRYEADGDYTFGINYTDLANLSCPGAVYAQGSAAATQFTIDKTMPVINVSYDNNNAANGNFYKEGRRATIVITEHNFNAEQVDITMTATDGGAPAAVPAVSNWISDGDRHTATVSYSGDGEYTFDISMRDQAGNQAADYEGDTFVVDTTVPVLEVTGVANNSANSGAVIPVISYSDTNYDMEQVTITLTGANRGTVALDGTYGNIPNGQVFTFNNFAEEKEVDDIYTLTAAITDRAGNNTTETLTFSVNRFGSTYMMDEHTKNMNGAYVKEPKDAVLMETNVNELQNIQVTMFKNNETVTLTEGNDYKIDVVGGNGSWYQYTYTVYAKNFAADGVYRISFHSEDIAGNVAENTLADKDAELRFGVDRTVPNVVVANLENAKTYALENLTVEMSASDNLLLSEVSVYLDDYSQAYKTWNREEISAIAGSNQGFSFDIPGTAKTAHQMKVVCRDAAGNEQIEEIVDFYVTTDIFVRIFNNKIQFFGTIIGVVLLAGTVVYVFGYRRRKKANK